MRQEKFTDKLLLGRQLRHFPELFEVFSNDEHPEIRWNIARLRDTPAEILLSMVYDCDVKVRRALSHNPYAPVEALEILANDSDQHVCFGVATHKDVSIVALRSLSRRKEIILCQLLAKNKNTPKDVLLALAGNNNPLVRQAVAYNASASEGAIRILLTDKHNGVQRNLRRAGCSFWRNSYSDIQIQLFETADVYLKSLWARHGKNDTLLRHISNDEDVGLRAALASNISLPETVLHKLINDRDESVRDVAMGESRKLMLAWKESRGDWKRARDKDTSQDILRKLAIHENYSIRGMVAQNLNAPAETLMLLVNDKHHWVRSCVLNQRELPYEIVKVFLSDENANTRAQALKYKSIPSEVFKKYCQIWETPAILGAVACNPRVDVSFLQQLAEHKNDRVRSAVARNPKAPAHLLSRLASNDEHWIRSSVVNNKNTPQDSLDDLSFDTNCWVRHGVARYTNRQEVLDRLADNQETYLVRLVLKNKNTSEATLRKLAAHRSKSVRMAFFEIDQPHKYYSYRP